MKNPFVKYREQLPAIFVPIMLVLFIIALYSDNNTWTWLCISVGLFIALFTTADILTQHKK